jgi:hypothetical protein
MVEKALLTDYSFAEKDDTRKFFLSLQQLFIDWNDKDFESEPFVQLKRELEEKINLAKAK